jgi:F0F1-type ATP synthase membrane subunit b/b'
MIRLSPRLGLGLGLGLALSGALAFGVMRFAAHHYQRGYDARSVELQAALDQAQAKLDTLAAIARTRAAALAATEAENQTLLEDLAHEADRDFSGIRLGPDSVRRLNAIAGHAPD